MRQDLGKKRELLQHAAADELLHAVAMVALADAGDGGIDGDDQTGEPGDTGALDGRLGGGPAAHQIELVEHGPRGAGLHVFERVARDGREDVGRAGLAGCASGRDLAARMHETAVSHRGQQEGQGEVKTQRRGVRRSQSESATAWRGRNVTSSKARQFSRSVTSPSAPPSR